MKNEYNNYLLNEFNILNIPSIVYLPCVESFTIGKSIFLPFETFSTWYHYRSISLLSFNALR